MNMFTRVSDKGQVVVPKAARDRLGWQPGTELEISESSDAITLRPRARKGKIGVEEARARLSRIYVHVGAPVPVEQLSWSASIAGDDDA